MQQDLPKSNQAGLFPCSAFKNPNVQQNSPSSENQQAAVVDASRNFGVTDEISPNPSEVSQPTPRVPPAKPGRVVGSVVPYENGRNVKDSYNSRIFYRTAVLPPQTVVPHCFFRTSNINQEKSGLEAGRGSSHVKPESMQAIRTTNPAPGIPIDVNTNPYYQPQVDQMNDQSAMDVKLLQAQSQFGAVGGAAAVAVAAHKNVGTV